MADSSASDPPTELDPLAAARATIVGLEAIADLFASFAMQANRLAGVLDASITDPDTLLETWPASQEDLRAARAAIEADEIERRLAEDDDRTEVISVRFPRP